MRIAAPRASRKYSFSTWVERVTPFSRVLSCPAIFSDSRLSLRFLAYRPVGEDEIRVEFFHSMQVFYRICHGGLSSVVRTRTSPVAVTFRLRKRRYLALLARVWRLTGRTFELCGGLLPGV